MRGGAGPADEPRFDLEVRRRVYRAIREHPGCHARKLSRVLDMPISTLAYHLEYLEGTKVLTSRRDRYYRRFYPTHDPDRGDRPLMNVLRREPLQRALGVLLAEGGTASYAHLREALDAPPSTLSLHLKTLVDSGVLVRLKDGRETLYRVHDVERVVGLLLKHRQSFLADLVDRAAEWLAAGYTGDDALGAPGL